MNKFGVFLSKFPDFMNEFMISWFMIDNSRAAKLQCMLHNMCESIYKIPVLSM